MKKKKHSKAVWYSTIISIIFLIFDLGWSRQIASNLSPHHYDFARDTVVRTIPRIDLDDGINYPLVVAWYNPEHELHEVRIQQDQSTTIWYRDLNGTWHQAHDLGPGWIQFVMVLLEITSVA